MKPRLLPLNRLGWISRVDGLRPARDNILVLTATLRKMLKPSNIAHRAGAFMPSDTAAILSVSYDHSLLRTRQLMLEGRGYRVTSAYGFCEAKMHCGAGGFDLFILGHSIPHEDKKELIALFRSHCHAPILSLLREGEEIVDGADYQASPDDPKKLIEVIQEIIPNRSRRAAG